MLKETRNGEGNGEFAEEPDESRKTYACVDASSHARFVFAASRFNLACGRTRNSRR